MGVDIETVMDCAGFLNFALPEHFLFKIWSTHLTSLILKLSEAVHLIVEQHKKWLRMVENPSVRILISYYHNWRPCMGIENTEFAIL